MRTKAFILTIMVAAVLSSCSRHETPVTGNYGSRVLSGQVVMASDVTNGSPAGLEVSVVGTGMTATLGADGRFTFVGVPENAELMFQRADGIDSRLRLSGVSSSLTVEVSAAGVKQTNSSGARRRASSKKDPGPAQEYEGTLVSDATATALTLHDSHGNDVEFALTDNTLIRKGNAIVPATDLKQGDRVHVKALTIDGVLTAMQVIVQNQGEDDDDDDEEGTTMTANGPVRSVGPLVVFSQSKGEITVNTDDNTIIRKQGQIITVDDIKVDDEINCLGTRVDDTTMLARQIEVRGNNGNGKEHGGGGGNGGNGGGNGHEGGNGGGNGNGQGKGGGH